MKNFTIGRVLVLFVCLLAISIVGRFQKDVFGASAAADPTFTDATVMRYITNVDSTTLTNPLTVTAFSSAWPFPANSRTAGDGFHVRANGRYNAGVGGNLEIDFLLGGTQAITTTAFIPAAVVQGFWSTDVQGTWRTAGPSGTWVGRAVTNLSTVTLDNTTTQCGGRTGAGLSSPTIPIDTTVSQNVQIGAKFQQTSGSNNITLEQMTIQTLR